MAQMSLKQERRKRRVYDKGVEFIRCLKLMGCVCVCVFISHKPQVESSSSAWDWQARGEVQLDEHTLHGLRGGHT